MTYEPEIEATLRASLAEACDEIARLQQGQAVIAAARKFIADGFVVVGPNCIINIERLAPIASALKALAAAEGKP